MEELLSKLIEKGWKPFGRNYQKYEHGCLIREFTTDDGVYSYGQYPTSLRELVSKESGLWQFVCENELTRKIRSGSEWKHNAGDEEEFNKRDYQYRLIETSLKNEDELEQFLLDNIIINEQA